MAIDQQSASAVVAAPTTQARGRRGRRQRPGLLLTLCTLLYALLLLAVSAVDILGPERWWIGSLSLYLPQWPLALPSAVILPWCLLRARRWSWIPVLMLGWALGPLMGWSFGLARLSPTPPGLHLRVMTYNVKWGSRGPSAVLANVAAANPDVIVMQDAAGAVDTVLAPLKKRGWRVVRSTQFLLLSRYPVIDSAAIPLAPEHSRDCVRCTLDLGSSRVTLFNTHLMTPRYALNSLSESGADGVGDIQQNALVRLREAAALARHVEAENVPVLVAGDLNAPIQSRVCADLFARGLRDAYSEAGWGYGYTYGQSTLLRRPYVRIDHILVSPEWSVAACKEGSPFGSDHSPVVADLVLRNSR